MDTRKSGYEEEPRFYFETYLSAPQEKRGYLVNYEGDEVTPFLSNAVGLSCIAIDGVIRTVSETVETNAVITRYGASVKQTQILGLCDTCAPPKNCAICEVSSYSFKVVLETVCGVYPVSGVAVQFAPETPVKTVFPETILVTNLDFNNPVPMAMIATQSRNPMAFFSSTVSNFKILEYHAEELRSDAAKSTI